MIFLLKEYMYNISIEKVLSWKNFLRKGQKWVREDNEWSWSSTLLSILGEYRSPNDKIVCMIDEGLLLPVKKGLYAVSPEITGIPLSLPLVANLLYGPSYVSMDFALYHYGIIPERVIEVTSMTTKRGKHYNLQVGRFS